MTTQIQTRTTGGPSQERRPRWPTGTTTVTGTTPPKAPATRATVNSVRGRFRPRYAPSLQKASLRLGAQAMKATPSEKTTSGHNRSVLLPGLRQARQRSGLTQRQLGTLAGVGKGTVLELEVGRRGAYPRTVRRLAKALETEVADLVGE